MLDSVFYQEQEQKKTLEKFSQSIVNGAQVHNINNKEIKRDTTNYKNAPIELVLNECEEIVKGKVKKTIQNPSLKILDHKVFKEELPKPNHGKFYDFYNSNFLTGEENKDFKMRMLICVTCYSESLAELKQTLDGIYSNLYEFGNYFIGSDDIAVVVVYDGCLVMNKTQHDLFKCIDQIYNIEKNKTLENRVKFFEERYKYELINTSAKTEMEKTQKKRIVELRNQIKELEGDKTADYLKYPLTSCYTYQFDYQPEKKEDRYKYLYLNLFLAVKLQNGGKLSSHMWFFRGFCAMFRPKYITLIDCGTVPGKKSIFSIFQAFEGDPQIGGVCGFMGLDLSETKSKPFQVKRENHEMDGLDLYKCYDIVTRICTHFFDIQRCQNFEYCFSHVLDKSFESLFGFIHVLPGAFSGYRWDALRSYGKQKSILDEEYLSQIFINLMKKNLSDLQIVSILDPDYQKRDEYNAKTANMFLAEDRILCLEIFTKKNYILKYIPDAECATDPIKNFLQLMKQRRRWTNGSWFALEYVLRMYRSKLENSTHSKIRSIFFVFSIVYSWIQMMNTYVGFALFFVFLKIGIHELVGDYYIRAFGNSTVVNPIFSVENIFVFLYVMALLGLFYYSLMVKKVTDKIKGFSFISSMLGIYMLITFGYYIYIIVTLFYTKTKKSIKNDKLFKSQTLISHIQVLIPMNILLYAVPCIFYPIKSTISMLPSVPSFLFFTPSYMHTLIIYAFCNVHDISWGTKGLDTNEAENKLREKFWDFKIDFVGQFLFVNAILAYILVTILTEQTIRTWFILIFAYYFTVNLAIKSISAIIFNIKYIMYDRIRYFDQTQKNRHLYKEDQDRNKLEKVKENIGDLKKKIQKEKQKNVKAYIQTAQGVQDKKTEKQGIKVVTGKQQSNRLQQEQQNKNNANLRMSGAGDIVFQQQQPQQLSSPVKYNKRNSKNKNKSTFAAKSALKNQTKKQKQSTLPQSSFQESQNNNNN